MEKQFVKISFDVHCTWEGFWPEYRIYVNGEMLTERTFKWDKNTHIKEILQIEAAPGIYTVHLEELAPKSGTFTRTVPTVVLGNATILDKDMFEII